ncbi:hypothetical protein LTR95_012838 [Oleoguttula sp. CCFEE 5521]
MPPTRTKRSRRSARRLVQRSHSTPRATDVAIPHIYGTYSADEIIYYITLPAAARDLWRGRKMPAFRTVVCYDDGQATIHHPEMAVSFDIDSEDSYGSHDWSATPSSSKTSQSTATSITPRRSRYWSAESFAIKSEPIDDHDVEIEDGTSTSSGSSESSPEGAEQDDQTSVDFQASSSPMREERLRAASKAGMLTISASERRLLAKDLMKPFLSFGVRDELLAMIHAASRVAKASMYESFMDEDESEDDSESGSEDRSSPISTGRSSSTPGLLDAPLPRIRVSHTPPRMSPSPDVSRRRRGKNGHFHDACAEASDACGEKRKRQRT